MTPTITRNRILIPVLTLAIGLVLGLALRGSGKSGPAPTVSHQSEATVWTCSMHPQIRLPEPGQCPICGMDLIPANTGGGGSSAGTATLTMSDNAQRMAEVTTAPVERRAVSVTVRTVGKLEADETRVREISAWVPGRIDRLHVDFTGVAIRAGDPLFDIYSPEIYATQEELLEAIRGADALDGSSLNSMRESGPRTVDAVREKLSLLGLSDAQISAIQDRGAPSETVTILSPISGVVLHKDALLGGYVDTGTHVYTIADLSVLWLQMDVYESDLGRVRLGQSVGFETDTYPGEVFPGKVSFIDPVLTEMTRSVRVRVKVPNPDGRLKPGMFARARIVSEIAGQDGRLPLVVPAAAPLVTGTRAVVYVEDPSEPGTFHGREVVLGARAGEWWIVRSGLNEGEAVVVRGNFKIDSELQIQAGHSMMSPAGGSPGRVGGHDHDSGHGVGTPSASGEVPDVPDAARREVETLLGEYYAVSEALSHDDLHAAVTASAELARRAKEAVGGAYRQREWITTLENVVTYAETLAKTADLEAARIPLDPLSNTMIRLVRGFGAAGTSPVYVIHCPMAHGNGADWLQPATGTENPYYGASMLKCGAVAETLRAGTAPTARDEE